MSDLKSNAESLLPTGTIWDYVGHWEVRSSFNGRNPNSTSSLSFIPVMLYGAEAWMTLLKDFAHDLWSFVHFERRANRGEVMSSEWATIPQFCKLSMQYSSVEAEQD